GRRWRCARARRWATCAWRRPRSAVRRGQTESGRGQPRYADLASSQRLETQQKAERETGEQEPTTGENLRAKRLFPPSPRPTPLDMIGLDAGAARWRPGAR